MRIGKLILSDDQAERLHSGDKSPKVDWAGIEAAGVDTKDDDFDINDWIVDPLATEEVVGELTDEIDRLTEIRDRLEDDI